MKNNSINKPLREKHKLPLNEMASYYQFKGDPEEARKAVHDVKTGLKPGILWDALDKLEKEGEIDLAKLADDRNVDRAVYAHPTKQVVFNKDLKDYLKPDTSPYLKQLKQFKKKAPPPPPKSSTMYPGKFDIIEKPDGTIELVDKKGKAIIDVPITKDTSLFDKKTTINKKLKFSSNNAWPEAKQEEGKRLKREWWETLVKKGIMSYDEITMKFRIVPERISDYEKELEKFIPKWEKQMAAINENRILYKQLMETLI